MSFGDKCIMGICVWALIVSGVVISVQRFDINQKRTIYEMRIAVAGQNLTKIQQRMLAQNEQARVMQQNLANVRQTLITQNENIKTILLRLQRTQTMEDVDVVLNGLGIQRVEPLTKKR